MSDLTRGHPVITRFAVRDYRVLADVELDGLTPLTVLVGPNGSGKSTLLDAVAFLGEAVGGGMRRAWSGRGGRAGLLSKGASGPVTFEVDHRWSDSSPLMTYHLEIDEEDGAPVVLAERLLRAGASSDDAVLELERGTGWARPGDGEKNRRIRLVSPGALAVDALGQVSDYEDLVRLRELISGWAVVDPRPPAIRSNSDVRTPGVLSRDADNLAEVVEHLRETRPEVFELVLTRLRRHVPRLESVSTRRGVGGRLELNLKDDTFDSEVRSAFASDGTLRLLAFLVVLHTPAPPRLIGLEEPENYLHPRLMYSLAEEVREAAGRSQVLVTTHSPQFVDAVRPEELRVLARDDRGFARVTRVADLDSVVFLVDGGEALGQVWSEGQFGVGDPFEGSS